MEKFQATNFKVLPIIVETRGSMLKQIIARLKELGINRSKQNKDYINDYPKEPVTISISVQVYGEV